MTSIDLTDDAVLTVEEAARVLRISRNAAYALACQWRATGGQSGLPCLELGRCIRVPRSALAQMLASSPKDDGAPRDRSYAPQRSRSFANTAAASACMPGRTCW